MVVCMLQASELSFIPATIVPKGDWGMGSLCLVKLCNLCHNMSCGVDRIC